MHYSFLNNYNHTQLKKFLAYITGNIHRSNKHGWCRHMLPVWTTGKHKAEQLLNERTTGCFLNTQY